uniref:Sulfotransferase domain-containing protein n=1 Tax=Fibrocapsa japonica TaxID=94617 RepID=A0A7S2V2C5_9STRA
MMVSLYYHSRSKPFGFYGNWNDFYKIFMAGQAECGDWFQFTSDWLTYYKQHPDTTLLLKYEDMLEDHKGAIRKLAKFSGLPCTDELLEDVAQKSSFGSMKANPLANFHQIPQKEEPHLRKGVKGDWVNHFTIAQSEEFDRIFKERMAGIDLFDLE